MTDLEVEGMYNPFSKNKDPDQLCGWFKQYLFVTDLHIQYIIFCGTGFDQMLLNKLINIIF